MHGQNRASRGDHEQKNFSKTYGIVKCEYMFQAMKAIGIHSNFIDTTKLIFQKVGAVVNINDKPSKRLDIQWEMRQKNIP